MKKNEYLIVFLVLFVFIVILMGVVLFLALNRSVNSGVESCGDCLGTKGLLGVVTDGWDVDDDHLVFFYSVDNYGVRTAKNIMVRCKFMDLESNLIFSGLQDIGSLEAGTSKSLDLSVPRPLGLDTDGVYSMFCYVESCDNCDIIYKRISSMTEAFEIE